MMEINWKKAALFAGGTLFGSAGIKLLTSKDAKDINEARAAAAEQVVEDTGAEEPAPAAPQE